MQHRTDQIEGLNWARRGGRYKIEQMSGKGYLKTGELRLGAIEGLSVLWPPGMIEAKSSSLYARLIPEAKKPPNGATRDAKSPSTRACS